MNEKRFDKYEQRGNYHWKWYVTNKRSYRENIDFVLSQLPSRGTVLDIGGGDGLLSYKMFVKGLDVVCLDSSPVGIQLASEAFEKELFGGRGIQPLTRSLARAGVLRTPLMRRYLNGKLKAVAESIYDLHFDDGFDFVVCHEVIEHVPDPARLLQIIADITRQFAIISTPNGDNMSPHPLDYFTWTPDTFRELLAGYKYEFIKIEPKHMYVKLYP